MKDQEVITLSPDSQASIHGPANVQGASSPPAQIPSSPIKKARSKKKSIKRKSDETKGTQSWPKDFTLSTGACFRIGRPFQSGPRSSWKFTFLTPYFLDLLENEDKRLKPALNMWSSGTNLQVAVCDFDNLEKVKESFADFDELNSYLWDNFPNAVHSVTQSGKPKMFLLFDFGYVGTKLTADIVRTVLKSYLPDFIYSMIDDSATALQIVYLNQFMVLDLIAGLPELVPIVTVYSNPFVQGPRIAASIQSTPCFPLPGIATTASSSRGSRPQIPNQSTTSGDAHEFIEPLEDVNPNQGYEEEVGDELFNNTNLNINKKTKKEIDIYNVRPLNKYEGPLPPWAIELFRTEESTYRELFLRYLINIAALESGGCLSSNKLALACGCSSSRIRRIRKEFRKFGLICISNDYRFGSEEQSGPDANRSKRYMIAGDLRRLRQEVIKGIKSNSQATATFQGFPDHIDDGTWNDTLFTLATSFSKKVSSLLMEPLEVERVFLEGIRSIPGHDQKRERMEQAANAIHRALEYRTKAPKSIS